MIKGSNVTCYYDGIGNPLNYRGWTMSWQGDMVGILDASGTTVATYTYKAWGKLLSSTGDLASINPLRYRGYYYDAELEMYYLKSRYYDPEICRFINADDFASTGITIIGCNTFAYCNNNPVKYCDTNGHGPVAAFLTLLGLIMLATTALMSYHNAARALPESNDVADADPTTTTRNKLIKDQNGHNDMLPL